MLKNMSLKRFLPPDPLLVSWWMRFGMRVWPTRKAAVANSLVILGSKSDL